MKKNSQKLLTGLWIMTVMGIRILYLFLQQHTVTDTYGYFAGSMIRASEKEPILTSGMALAYTENLSMLLRFTGNTIGVILIYNLVMQIAWLILVFFGTSLLWGKVSGFVTGSILAVSPWILSTIDLATPENFFMLRFAFLLLLAGCFYNRTLKAGWYRSSICELLLMCWGFCLGVMCTWNYVSWLLIPILIYVFVRNCRIIKEKSWLVNIEIKLREKDQLMPVGSQIGIILVGLVIGMLATLMKYTGLTGLALPEQFLWWLEQYKAFPMDCQNISVWIPVWLIGAFWVGIFIQFLANKMTEARLRKKTLAAEQEKLKEESKEEPKKEPKEEPKEEPKKEEPKEETKEETKEVIKEEPKKVKMIKNPLPVPAKHVAKKMQFDIEDFSDNKQLEFDKNIESSDDFDI